MTATTHYILHTIADAPGAMTVEGLMQRLLAGVAERLLRVHLQELLQGQQITTRVDADTGRTLITGVASGARARLQPAVDCTPTVRRKRQPRQPESAELLARAEAVIEQAPATVRTLAAALDLTLEEANSVIRVLHRQRRAHRHVDEAAPASQRHNYFTILWIGSHLQRQRAQAAAPTDPPATPAEDENDSTRHIADLVTALPRLHAIASQLGVHS